jgi:hypothetical protein
MKASVLYRTAAVLLLLFAAGHTFGFRQSVPDWRGTDSLIASMQSIHFDAQGFRRTYWDFFSAFGFYFSVFLVFAAVLSWQLGAVPSEPLARRIAWGLVISLAAVTALTWGYGFTTPLVFSVLITVCLTVATTLSTRLPSSTERRIRSP